MKQNDLISNETKNYIAPLIQVEEVIVEQGYAATGTGAGERDWIHGGEMKDGYE